MGNDDAQPLLFICPSPQSFHGKTYDDYFRACMEAMENHLAAMCDNYRGRVIELESENKKLADKIEELEEAVFEEEDKDQITSWPDYRDKIQNDMAAANRDQKLFGHSHFVINGDIMDSFMLSKHVPKGATIQKLDLDKDFRLTGHWIGAHGNTVSKELDVGASPFGTTLTIEKINETKKLLDKNMSIPAPESAPKKESEYNHYTGGNLDEDAYRDEKWNRIPTSALKIEPKKTLTKPECNHKWQRNNGVMDSYYYCTLCPKTKRG